ncbi:MAG: nitrite reductase small subunit NirD [Colwellia sp.]|nr:nitrite reductase small subunit NirD [Colwellia sp.]
MSNIDQQVAWIDICKSEDILPNMGRCALFENEQVAIFRVIESGVEKIYAINNHCPFSQANIISRGIVGCLSNKTVVASPLYKQHFDLATGQCIEDEAISVKTYAVRFEGDMIQLAA